ncbi:MAG TPA: cation:proton antiporter, partial [Candidatus Acidoferrum sp.]|nr:cation:proton antiporter [Candidatus Acidoferrum sp.]
MYSTLIVLVIAGLLGPLLSYSRRPLVPVVLGELLGGILLGRTGLGWIDPTAGAMPAFYSLGFGLLMVTAGQHVDVDSPGFRTGLKTAMRVLLVVALTALPIGAAIATLEGSVSIALITILLIGSSAAIVMPIVDEQRLSGPTITILTGWIGLADGLTVIAMPLALTGADHLVTALLGDLAIVAVAAGLFWVVVRTETRPSVKELIERSRQRGWALQLRMSLFALAILGAIAEATG